MWRQNPLPPNWHTIRNQILQRDNYTCQHCGSHQNLEVDHIIPAWKLGWDNHNPNNLQTLCKRCHTQKTQHERITYTRQKPRQQATQAEEHPFWHKHTPPGTPKTRTHKKPLAALRVCGVVVGGCPRGCLWWWWCVFCVVVFGVCFVVVCVVCVVSFLLVFLLLLVCGVVVVVKWLRLGWWVVGGWCS